MKIIITTSNISNIFNTTNISNTINISFALMDQTQKTPKQHIRTFIEEWFGPLVETIESYIQEPENLHLQQYISVPEKLFLEFRRELGTITTMEQLKIFERKFFQFICTIDDKNIVALWNESLQKMSKFMVTYRNEEFKFLCNTYYRPRYILLTELLDELLASQIEDVGVHSEIERIQYNIGFTAPEFDERMREHITALKTLITKKCANSELAKLYNKFNQQNVALWNAYKNETS